MHFSSSTACKGVGVYPALCTPDFGMCLLMPPGGKRPGRRIWALPTFYGQKGGLILSRKPSSSRGRRSSGFAWRTHGRCRATQIVRGISNEASKLWRNSSSMWFSLCESNLQKGKEGRRWWTPNSQQTRVRPLLLSSSSQLARDPFTLWSPLQSHHTSSQSAFFTAALQSSRPSDAPRSANHSTTSQYTYVRTYM